MPPRVAVIGAGVSGLACAQALFERAFHVKVFDKGRRAGGRTSTRRVAIEGLQVGFDHGAQYFTVRDPQMERLVAQWEALGVAKRWKGRIAAIDADGAVELSSDTARFVGTPRMSAICEHLALGRDVRYEVTVHRLERHDNSVELFQREGASLGRFDVVVCSAPPVQTAALLAEVAPEIAAKAASVTMKPCWALMAAFDSTLDLPFDGAFINQGPLSWVARTSRKPGRVETPDRWVLHASPKWSTEHLEQESEVVVEPLLDAFFEAVGLPAKAPIWAGAHRWRYALAENPLEEGCLFDASMQIGACGDWTSGNRVEGAFLSGRRAAQRITEAWGEA